jgi:phospho-N-acetylmuramoyl-pentapeptide-transferase
MAFWIAFCASALLAWPALVFLRRTKSLSVISPYAPETHQSKKGTPNMGGLFVIAAVLIAASIVIPSSVWPIAILILGMSAIGFLDDYVMPVIAKKGGLGWIPKLLLQIIVVGAYSAWIGFGSETLIAAFFILFFANAVNFTDGLDALASTVFILALVPFVIATQSGFVIALGLSAMGALGPFLFLNSPPAKIFMGDVGALAIGGIYGFVFTESPWRTDAWPWIASVILILELVLVPIQIGAVKTVKRRIFPATPIHHGFEKMGWPESKVLWTIVTAQFVLTAAAITVILR